jgi:hypothetical protein
VSQGIKLFVILAGLTIGARLLVFWLRDGSGARWLKRFSKYPAPHPTYLGLRERALRLSRAEIGFLPAASETQPWGVVMDWGMDHGVATVVAFADGSASVYTSTGGGSIGGQTHEAIRNAAHEAVNEADRVLSIAHRTNYIPLPKRGRVFFYLRTDAGIFTARSTEKALSAGLHPLSKLGNAMQGVITQYRAIEASGSSASDATPGKS